MDLNESVKTNFNDSFLLKEKIIDVLPAIVVKAGSLLAETIKNGGKILSCGNGGSASDAGHFVAEIVNRFQIERDGLPAISLASDVATLTAIANDHEYKYLFSKQIKALGNKADVLLVITTSGNSQNILEAINKAHKIGMPVIALTGKDGGEVVNILNPSDIEIRVPSKITPRIQEIHILVIHCLCDLVDRILFPNKFEKNS